VSRQDEEAYVRFEAYASAQMNMLQAIRDYWTAGLKVSYDESSLANTICDCVYDATDKNVKFENR